MQALAVVIDVLLYCTNGTGGQNYHVCFSYSPQVHFKPVQIEQHMIQEYRRTQLLRESISEFVRDLPF